MEQKIQKKEPFKLSKKHKAFGWFALLFNYYVAIQVGSIFNLILSILIAYKLIVSLQFFKSIPQEEKK